MTDPRLEQVLAGITQPGPVDDDTTDYEPDYMTDNQADREYGEDADRAADRYEAERGY